LAKLRADIGATPWSLIAGFPWREQGIDFANRVNWNNPVLILVAATLAGWVVVSWINHSPLIPPAASGRQSRSGARANEHLRWK
jgi:hypothetical protein